GVELLQVTQGGPAEKAGLKPGDVVVAVDDKPVRSYRALLEIVRGHKPGDKVKVSRRRAKDVKVVELTLATRTAAAAAGPGARAGGDRDRPFATSLGGQIENAQDRQGRDGYQYGGVYRSGDGGETWARVNSLNPRPMYFSCIRVDPNDSNYLYVCGVQLHRSKDGGKTFTQDGGNGVHPDQHTLWIDPKDGRHMIV